MKFDILPYPSLNSLLPNEINNNFWENFLNVFYLDLYRNLSNSPKNVVEVPLSSIVKHDQLWKYCPQTSSLAQESPMTSESYHNLADYPCREWKLPEKRKNINLKSKLVYKII